MPESINGNGNTTGALGRIPKEDREELYNRILEFSGGDIKKIDATMIQTAVKSMVQHPGCAIAGKPEITAGPYGEVLHIPIKNSAHPAVISVKYVQAVISRRV